MKITTRAMPESSPGKEGENYEVKENEHEHEQVRRKNSEAS